MGDLHRPILIPQENVGMGTPEIIRTSKYRILELIHSSLLLEEEVQSVLHTAQEIE
jgi:hypothetical protein